MTELCAFAQGPKQLQVRNHSSQSSPHLVAMPGGHPQLTFVVQRNVPDIIFSWKHLTAQNYMASCFGEFVLLCRRREGIDTQASLIQSVISSNSRPK